MKAAHAGVAAFFDGIAESSCPHKVATLAAGAKAGKRRVIGPGPKQLRGSSEDPGAGSTLSVLASNHQSIYRLLPAPAGLPLLVQFVGPYFAGATPFQVAREWERTAGTERKHPPVV